MMTAKKFKQFAQANCTTDDEILAALEQRDRLAAAIVRYLSWGPMTGSDRDLHDQAFRDALGAKPKKRGKRGERGDIGA